MFTQIQCLTQIQIVYSNQREIHKASIFLKNKKQKAIKTQNDTGGKKSLGL